MGIPPVPRGYVTRFPTTATNVEKEGCEFFSIQASQSWVAGSVSPGCREMSTVNRSDP